MKVTILPLITFALLVVGCKSSQPTYVQVPYGYQQPYPNYNGYQPQGGYQQQNVPVNQQGYQQQNMPVNQNQQQSQNQQNPDVDGFVEVKRSPIEELALAVGTDETRAFGAAESGNAQLAFNAARAQATAALKEKMEVYVRAGLDQYSQETG